MIPDRFRVVLFALVAPLVATAIYLPSINAPFVYDDRHAIYQNPAVLGGAEVSDLFIDPSHFSARPNKKMYRPLTLLSYSLTYRFAGFSMPAWHIFHMVFHALNAILVFLIALRLFGDRRGALMAALLWAIHPLGSEAVIYQGARSSLMAGMSVFGGFYMYVSGDKSSPRRVLSVLLLAVGFLCKENVVVLPVLILWYDANRYSLKELPWRRYVPHGAVVLVYFLMRWAWLDLETLQMENPPRSVGVNLFSQAGSIMMYLRLAFWPAGLCIDHDLSEVAGWFPLDIPFWRRPAVAIPVLVMLALSGILLRRKAVAWSMAVAWWFVVLMPESSIIPLIMVANERRTYMPLAGLCLAAGAGMSYLMKKNRAMALTASAVVVICLVSLTGYRVGEWKTKESLWSSARIVAPHSVKVLHGLAAAKLENNDVADAERLYRLMIRRDPEYYGARIGLGRILSKKKGVLHAEAEEHLRVAIRLGPERDLPWVTLSDMYINEGSTIAAEKAARKAVELNDRSVQGWNNLGVALGNQGRIKEALEALDRAISLAPRYAIGRLNRGHALRQLGRMDEARDEYLKAIEIDPSLKMARKALELLDSSPELPDAPQ